MPNIHKVTLSDDFEIEEVVAQFVSNYAPEAYTGIRGEFQGFYYVNEETLIDMKEALKKEHYIYNKEEYGYIMNFLQKLTNIVKKEGLYEFYLEE